MSLKNKYNLFYFLFCIVGCCMAGFVAVFLQYKGVSNTMIGVVTGVGCVSSVALSPYLSSLIMKYEKLTAQNMTAGIYTALAVGFVVIAYDRFRQLSPSWTESDNLRQNRTESTKRSLFCLY